MKKIQGERKRKMTKSVTTGKIDSKRKRKKERKVKMICIIDSSLFI